MSLYRSFLKALFLAAGLSAIALAQSTPAADKPAQAPAQSTAQPTDQPPPPAPGTATHVMGFESVKRDAKGKFSVDDKSLKFGKASIDIASIQDVFTGSQSRQTGGTALTVAKMAVPYGGGRVLSLFSHEEVDNITIDYSDSNGGYHSAIFMLPKGQAEHLKKELVAHGAKASIPVVDTPKEAAKEKK